MRNVFTVFRYLVPAVLLVGPPLAQANLSERFDSGNGGWTAVDLDTNTLDSAAYVTPGDLTDLVFNAAGGNPGGYISAQDPSNKSFFFHAPAAFLGDLSAYVGGTVSFDTFYLPRGQEWRGDPDILISNGTDTLAYQGPANPGGTWTHVSTTLAPGAGWRMGGLLGGFATAGDFATVLGSVTLFRIRGEYVAGIDETTGLDNVTVAAIPEPRTWAMLFAGLGLLVLVGARRGR